MTPDVGRELDGLALPDAHTSTAFPPAATPAAYLPSGDTATMDRAGTPCGCAGGTAGELACTERPQGWPSWAAPVRLKTGTTEPMKPVSHLGLRGAP